MSAPAPDSAPAPPPAPPTVPPVPPVPPAPVSRSADLLRAMALMILIAAVIFAAGKYGGWFWLGPAALFVGFIVWFLRLRMQFIKLLETAMHGQLEQGHGSHADRCFAEAIDHYEKAGQLAIRLHKPEVLTAASRGRDASAAAAQLATERLAFVLYGLHIGRQTALARIQSETVINLTGMQVGDDELTAIPSLPQLQRLQLRGRQITDRTLRLAAGAHGLIELYLEQTAITDAGLHRFRAHAWLPDSAEFHAGRAQQQRDADDLLAAAAAIDASNQPPPPPPPPRAINNLKFLHIDGARLTDAALPDIAAFTALERLSLHSTQITAAGIAQLRWLPNLEYFSADGTALNDQALIDLARLPALEHLALDHTAITPTGLNALHQAARLKRLDLSQTPLTAAAVTPLSKLTGLTVLNLRDCGLTPVDQAALKAALPDCQISI